MDFALEVLKGNTYKLNCSELELSGGAASELQPGCAELAVRRLLQEVRNSSWVSL